MARIEDWITAIRESLHGKKIPARVFRSRPVVVMGRMDGEGIIDKLNVDIYNVQSSGTTYVHTRKLLGVNNTAGSIAGDGVNPKAVTIDTGAGYSGAHTIQIWMETAASASRDLDAGVALECSTDNSTFYKLINLLPVPGAVWPFRSLLVDARYRYIRATFEIPTNLMLCWISVQSEQSS